MNRFWSSNLVLDLGQLTSNYIMKFLLTYHLNDISQAGVRLVRLLGKLLEAVEGRFHKIKNFDQQL